MNFQKLPKLKKGDKVAIVSPSFAAPAVWPKVYELGLKRIREVFELEPVEFSVTKKLGASGKERAKDLIDAFENNETKAVIATLGGDDQVTYIKTLPIEPFVNNPKPFFGYSDNTHFINHLWLNGVPSFYGANLFTEFAMQGDMNDFTVKYLKYALFEEGEFELGESDIFCDEDLNWSDDTTLDKRRRFQENEGWIWDANKNAEGIIWGGCLESLDELLRHGLQIPSLEDLEDIILFVETSEELPSADYVNRVIRAFGERGVLERINGLIVGRSKAWSRDNQNSDEQKVEYKNRQRETIGNIVKVYNKDLPIIHNFDIGHTSPQICLPVGKKLRIDSENKKVYAKF